MHLKMSSGKWRPFCLSINVLMDLHGVFTHILLGASLALGQSNDFFSADGVTLKYMGMIGSYLTKTRHNNAINSLRPSDAHMRR